MVVFSDTYSIVGAVFAFLDGGRYVLFAIVFFFSLAFPSAKILIALWAWVLAGRDQDRMRRVMALFAAVSKWSMLDVFIIALTVLVAIRSVLLATAVDHAGGREGTSLGLAFAFMDGFAASAAVLAGLAGENNIANAFLLASGFSLVAVIIAVTTLKPARATTDSAARHPTTP